MILSLVGILGSCDDPTPAPDLLPIQSARMDEVPGAIGYFAFDVPGGGAIIGTAVVTYTLVAPGGSILATRVCQQAITTPVISQDEIANRQCKQPAWRGINRAGAAEWAIARLTYWEDDAQITTAGVWYTDLTSPQTPINGQYLLCTIPAYRYYFPIVFD